MSGAASKWWRAAESIDSRAVVSFDFDDVLHYAPGGNPIDFWVWEAYVPREPYMSEAKHIAGTHRVIVVSRRDPGMEDVILDFTGRHGLHIDRDDVYCVGISETKRDVLEREGAAVHYDDSPYMAGELHGTGIRLVHVQQTNETDLSWVPNDVRKRFPRMYGRYERLLSDSIDS